MEADPIDAWLGRNSAQSLSGPEVVTERRARKEEKRDTMADVASRGDADSLLGEEGVMPGDEALLVPLCSGGGGRDGAKRVYFESRVRLITGRTHQVWTVLGVN